MNILSEIWMVLESTMYVGMKVTDASAYGPLSAYRRSKQWKSVTSVTSDVICCKLR